jgi:AhpD family alkylhydroperoxidase
MEARMTNPAMVVPGAVEAAQKLWGAVMKSGLPQSTLELVHIRASLINGCGFCLGLHTADGHTAEELARFLHVGGWREVPGFSEAERAALALTEAVTRIADSSDPVPDDVWNEAARHYDEHQLGALLIAISTVNVWNRLNVSTRQVAGTSWD